MKRMALVLLLLFFGVALAAGPANVLVEADLAFGRDANSRGLDGWMAWFAEDSTVFPSSGPPAVGKAAVRAYYESIKFDPRALKWKPLRAELVGDLGYTWGTWSWTEPGPDGKPKTATGKYMTIWRHQEDGSWKVEADIGAPDKG